MNTIKIHPGFYRKPWASPKHLDVPLVRKMVRLAHQRNVETRDPHPLMKCLPPIGFGLRNPEYGARGLTAKIAREQAVALYRAGAVWLNPHSNAQHCGYWVCLTPEAATHPDVVEMLWAHGRLCANPTQMPRFWTKYEDRDACRWAEVAVYSSPHQRALAEGTAP